MSEAAVLGPTVSKPGHVPEAAVFDFDMFHDPELGIDPHRRILELARNAPKVFWTPRNGGHWIFQGQNAVWEAARDADSFSNESIPYDELMAILASVPEGSPHVPIPYPLMLDPPLHHKYRQPLQQVFSPRTVMGLKDDIRALAVALIDGLADKDGCDFIAAVAEPLPVQIFLKMFGLPQDMMPAYRALVKENLAQSATGNNAAGMLRMMKVTEIMRDVVLARRDEPQNDVISMLWAVEIDGRPTTLEDVENYAVLLFIAGLDTVVNGMGYAAKHLAQDQQLQARLRAEPALIPEAVEEMLRRYTFVAVPRRVKKDLTFHGLEMKKDERVQLYLPAADLDADVFSDPQQYNLNRDNKVHIAFNAGPHRCLGSHLARLELQILYEELLARVPPFRLDPGNPPTYLCSQIISMNSLHLTWSA
jgi:cytochrome P450